MHFLLFISKEYLTEVIRTRILLDHQYLIPLNSLTKGLHCRKYIFCVICKKSFAHQKKIRVHKNSNIVSKQYECKKCHQLYSTNGNSVQHMRIPTGIKHLTCEECKKKSPIKFKDPHQGNS